MSGSVCAEAIRRGHRARQAGDTAHALACYREAAAADPHSAEAIGALGLMLLRAGETEASAPYLLQAVALDPAQPAFRMNLAELHARRGDVSAALAVVEVTIASHPEAWWAWERLGELQAARGHYPPARDAFARALALRPGDPAILYKLARAECDCGNPSAADALLGEAAARAPGHEAVMGLQAELLAARADWEGLEAQTQRWLACRPGYGPALRWLARARWERGYLTDALDTLRAALHAGPRDVAGLAALARLALLGLDFETAALALEEAETLAPGSPQLLQPRAILSMYRGDTVAAERCARQALQHDARDVASWKTLVQLCGGRLGAAELAALGELAESDALDARDRATAAFAFGDCLDACGRDAEAFAAWQRGNVLQASLAAREGLAYDPTAREREVDAIVTAFPAPREERAMPQPPLRPVFIVGMPRSGTTLLESVLAAHPAVLACGERAAMRTIMREHRALGREPRAEDIARWREDYFRGIAPQPGQRVLIDKNPWNIDAVGLTLRLFPDACILYLSRDADETALSIFRNEFPKFASFTNRLEDIAHYRTQVERLMRHWDAVLPGRVLSLSYEALVADVERVALAVLERCGLEWNERCLDFPRPGRIIATLSTVQVRQPLGSVRGRAARYREFLS